MKKTWKQTKLHNMEIKFGGRVEEYNGFSDDRLLYVNTYNAIVEAIKSLPEEPLNYIKVAINHQIRKDEEVLNRICRTFGE